MMLCTECGRELNKMVWLEFNNATGTYHRPGTVPPADSLGVYPFGADCARRLLKESK